MLRLLLLLDGEATDSAFRSRNSVRPNLPRLSAVDEFELDLLGLSWAHVTIFLIGVDGCPHHHRHANELSRISDVNQCAAVFKISQSLADLFSATSPLLIVKVH